MRILLIGFATVSTMHVDLGAELGRKIELRGAPFTLLQNAKNCRPCVKYINGDLVSGTFFVTRPLPKDAQGLNISDIVSKYRFEDRHNTVVSTDPSARKASFLVWTDGAADVTDYLITVEQTVPTKKNLPKRINALTMVNIDGARGEIAFANVVCKDENSTTAEPTKADVCRGNQLDAFSSRAERAPASRGVEIRSVPRE